MPKRTRRQRTGGLEGDEMTPSSSGIDNMTTTLTPSMGGRRRRRRSRSGGSAMNWVPKSMSDLYKSVQSVAPNSNMPKVNHGGVVKTGGKKRSRTRTRRRTRTKSKSKSKS